MKKNIPMQRSILYPEDYILSDFFDLTPVEPPNSWNTSLLMEISHQEIIMQILPSYTQYYNDKGKYIPMINGANYYYNDNAYKAFASFQAVGIYISNYCFQFGSFVQKYFDILLPKYILIFQTLVLDNKSSLDLYIGTKKENII